MIKTQNAIFTDLKSLIETALATADIAGWLVAQNYNPTQGHWNQPSIIMHRVRTEQYGAVGQRYRIKDDKFFMDMLESKEVTLQIDAISPRDLTGAKNKWESADIINFLRLYFSGPFGVKALKEKGYALAEKIRVVDEPTFQNEHDVMEYNPNLQIKLFYTDIQTQEVPALSAVEFKGIKGV